MKVHKSMNDMTPINPVHPPAAYIGGKRMLSKRLVALINKTSHTGYAEAFVGMGGVFFKRTHKPKAEAINDISGDVTNLFRILQRHYPQFMDTLKYQLTSRREFERLAASKASTLTDLERAARFIYLQKTAFGGKVTGQNFGISNERSARFNISRLGPMLEDVHERLSGVTIENLPWSEFIRRWDRKGMLFYLDPPYWGNETDYGAGVFSKDDFAQMAEQLSTIKGTFILSINDKPGVRKCFERFNMEPVDVHYSVAGGKGTSAKELIITNPLAGSG